MYETRIDRRSILLKWLIIMYKNMIHYAEHYPEYGLVGKSREYANRVIKNAKYVELNRSHLENLVCNC